MLAERPVGICILHYRKVYMRQHHSAVVMATTTPTNSSLERKLAAIDGHLNEIRHDVSEILHVLQDELKAFREREFWRDYRETYHQE